MAKLVSDTGSKNLNIRSYPNFPVGGVIDIAPNSVDKHSIYHIAQTTPNQTISLPAPTASASGTIYDKYVVKNTGSTSFLINGVTLLVNTSVEVTWNGSAFEVVSGTGGLVVASTPSSITAQVNTDYAVDTTGSAFNIFLPSAPANGVKVNFRDAFGTFATNNLTIVRGGTDTIEGGTSLVLNQANQVALVTYNAANTRWTVSVEQTTENIPNSPSSSKAPIAITNRATGGDIGTAVATVNAGSHFILTQTTVGQTVTLPIPTLATASRMVTLESGVGSTATFTLYGKTVLAGEAVVLQYNGTAWKIISATGGSDVSEFLNTSGVKNLTSATRFVTYNITSGNQTYNLPLASSSIGQKITFTKIDSNTVSVATLDGAGVENINGLPTYTLSKKQYSTTTIESDGTQWFVVNETVGTIVKPWVALKEVAEGELMSYSIGSSTVYMYSNVSRLTGALLNATELANWTYVSQNKTIGFTAGSFTLAGYKISVQGNVWEATSTRTSGTNFLNVAERAFWTMLSDTSTGTELVLSNYVASGSIGPATDTVDIASQMRFIQTTANVTLTIPNRTSVTPCIMSIFNDVTSTQTLTYTAGTDTFAVAPSFSTQIVWNGTSWKLLNPAQVVAEFGETALNADVAVSTVADVITFSLPSAGTWEVDWFANVSGLSNSTGAFWVSDNSNVAIADSGMRWERADTNALNLGYSNTVRITTTGASTYKLRASTNSTAFTVRQRVGSLSNAADVRTTKVAWKKISSLSPTTGGVTDYGSLVANGAASYGTVMYSVTTTNNISPAAPFASNQTILFNGASAAVVQNGNLPVTLATGIQTIGKTGVYNIKISASIQANGASDSTVLQLVKNNTTPIAASSGFNAAGGNIVSAHNLTYSGTLNAGDTLDVRVGANGVATHAIYAFSWTTTQLGTSASVKQTLAKVQGTFNGSSGTGLLLATTLDTIGSWNTGTGVFTAPRTADYNISGGIAFQSTNTYSNGYEILYLSGALSSRIAWGFHGTYSGYWGMSGAITVRLTAGQQIWFQCTKTNLIQTGVDSNISISELPNDFIN
jgi:hypothetical protein